MSGTWPDGLTFRPIVAWPRELKRRRTRSQFSATLSATLSEMRSELVAIQARNVVVQIAITEADLRLDGRPRANADPEHPGVILSMETPTGALSFPCDTFTTWQDNLRAIVKTMQNLRAINRYGVTQHGEQYVGWRAIEATATAAPFATVAEAVSFLASTAGEKEFDMTGSTQAERRGIRRMFLRRAKIATHPDTGGSDAVWHRVADAEEFLRDHDAL